MALIKCKECGQDMSTDAVACPHCGKPNSEPHRTSAASPVGTKALLIIVVGAIISAAMWSYGTHPELLLEQKKDIIRRIETIFGAVSQQYWLPSSGKPAAARADGTELPLQEVNNLGYTLYLTEIERSDMTNLTDDIKNRITKTAYALKVPPDVLSDIPIIIVNNLALTGDQYITFKGHALRMPVLTPEWLSEGGMYGVSEGGIRAIFINKPTIAEGRFDDVLAHELGHVVGQRLTGQDWAQFYELRDIPAGTTRRGESWRLSPEEDFAEVYKHVFTGAPIRTLYGHLTGLDMGACLQTYMDALQRSRPRVDPSDPIEALSFMSTSFEAMDEQASADPEIQKCRRSAAASGELYKSEVSPKTKSFIVEVAGRLNAVR